MWGTVEAHPRTLKLVFKTDVRLEVPLFQRRYVWTAAEQWEPLWEDVLATVDRIRAEDALPHFMGAIVLEQVRRPHGSIEVRQVIDGQQRLTTLQLLTAAVRDVAQSSDTTSRLIKRLGLMLLNDDELVDDEDEAYKLWPTNADRSDYRAVVSGQLREAPSPRTYVGVTGAYLWFRDEVRRWLDTSPQDGRPERIDDLARVILDGLELVVIDLGPDDNAQVIFETLNARGTPLLASDLIKNLLFRTLQDAGRPTERLYERYWRPLEEERWQEKVRQGRLNRPRLDAFVGHYLVVRLQREVQAHELFASLRDHVRRDAQRAEDLLVELARYGEVYDQLETLEGVTSEEAASLRRLQIADTQTVQPLLLWLFANHSGAGRARAVAAIESYLVRRTICRLTAKNYNRLFLDLLRRLTNGEGTPGEFVPAYLARQDSESGVWPSDLEIERSVVSLPVYKILKRERLQRILLALEQQARGPRTEPIQLTGSLSVEHLVPQQWREHWALPPGGDPVEAAAARDGLVHTLGNLTLVTQSLNSVLSNGPWQHKREELLRSSALTLNRTLPAVLDDAAIGARGRYLAGIAVRVWPRPELASGEQEAVDERERDLRPETEVVARRSSARATSGGRRDIAKHIGEAFEQLPAGSFLTISQIRAHRSLEYGGSTPSAGAISFRLFPPNGQVTLTGVAPAERDGVRGGIKTA